MSNQWTVAVVMDQENRAVYLSRVKAGGGRVRDLPDDRYVCHFYPDALDNRYENLFVGLKMEVPEFSGTYLQSLHMSGVGMPQAGGWGADRSRPRIQMTETGEPVLRDREPEEVDAALRELNDKIWYARVQSLLAKAQPGEGLPPNEDIVRRVKQGLDECERRYGKDNLGPWTEQEWGCLLGKLSALNWVRGKEWDMIDT